MFGRVLRTGLSSLRDRAAARLAALRFNPSRGRNGCPCRWCVYDAAFAKRIRWVMPWDRWFFDQLKEEWEATHHECNRLERTLASDE